MRSERVSRITEIVKKLESTGKTEDSTLRNPLDDLKETLDKAYEHIMECQNKNFLSKVIQSKALKKNFGPSEQEDYGAYSDPRVC